MRHTFGVIQKFSTNNFKWNGKRFVAEASECAFTGLLNRFELINPNTQKSQIFTLSKVDQDSTGEDTYGWWYRSVEGIELLVIND